MNDTTAIIVAIIGGASGLITALTTSIFKFLEYWKNRRGEGWEAKIDCKLKPLIDMETALYEKVDSNTKGLNDIKLDTTRLQLLMLLEHQPENIDTILKVAEHYFCVLRGDWYMTALFNKWVKEQKVAVPLDIAESTKHYK